MRSRFTTGRRLSRRGRARARLIAASALWLTLGVASVAQAQTFLGRPQSTGLAPVPSAGALPAPDAAALRVEQGALLARTLRNPTDFEATYAYVEVSRRLGDSEAAIGALERLVNYDPSLVRANYELGVLYYGLGSYDAASRYLGAAAASPALEPAVRARVEALYPEVVKQQGQSRWSGFAQVGLRYQSNPTFIPSGNTVRLNGQDFFLAPSERRRGDGSGFGLLQLGNDYDLQNQRGDVLETRFLVFGSGQFRASEFDFGYVEASFGPRFGLPELMPGASIKPYVVGQTSALRGERAPYVSSGGGGVTLRLPVLPTLTLEPGFEVRALSVNGRGDFNAFTFNTGESIAGYLAATARLSDDIELEARIIGLRGDARNSGQRFTKAGASVALGFQLDPPSSLIARKWKLSPFVGGAFLDFDRVNPAVDPFTVRRDREFSAGLVLDAPLTAMFGLSALVQYDRIDSNLPNYRQHGFTVLGGPTARF